MNQLWEDTNHVFCDKACISHPVTILKQNDISKAASNAFSFLTGASMAIGLFLGNGERNKVACVGGKQKQVAVFFTHVELDCTTFFPGIFFRPKI